jgi:hypothetical protein
MVAAGWARGLDWRQPAGRILADKNGFTIPKDERTDSMTTTVNVTTSTFLTATAYGAISNGIAIFAVLALLILLIERVLLKTPDDAEISKRSLIFDVAIWPLIFALAAISILQIASILGYWWI